MPKIVFLHPDLGIGGAERLVVDAALGFQRKGHSVHFITSHHDINHCFVETRDDGTLPITVAGDWLPRHICGRFKAVFAYLRMIYCAFYLVFFSNLEPDAIFVDLVSVAIPILKWKRVPVIFYCHYPDLLMSAKGGVFKRIYRAPLNWLEEITTGHADKILVNSKFTSGVFTSTFKGLKVTPDVLYPSLNSDFFDMITEKDLSEILPNNLASTDHVFLSINRYERKKNLKLAIQAMSELKNLLSSSEWDKVYLVMAGGYDLRVDENIQHFSELVQYATDLNLQDKVIFLKSPSDQDKVTLLKSSLCLIYTPSFEHFGIVPVEAMYMETPVVAVNSGGPMETVVSGKTGFLCEPDAIDVADALSKFVKNPKLSQTFGECGKRRVINNFSFNSFSNQLDTIVTSLLHKSS